MHVGLPGGAIRAAEEVEDAVLVDHGVTCAGRVDVAHVLQVRPLVGPQDIYIGYT